MEAVLLPPCACLLAAALLANPAARDSWMLYDDSAVAEVRVTVAPEALEWMWENPESDSLHVAEVHFRNALIDEEIADVGFRLRGNTSRDAAKKSFKLSFNTFVPGRQFYDVDKLNLNGEHNDPSIIRSKLCWDRFQDIGLIASQAAHATVYINDVYYGLYISVEHVDDEFLQAHFDDDSGNLWKCLYPADLAYLGPDPEAYKYETPWGRQPYELKTNIELDDYTELANLADVINNTLEPEFEAALEEVLVVEDFLEYLAINVLTGSWDDYWCLQNNYYLYHDPSKDRFRWIPFDYDNTFGIDFPNYDWANIDPYVFITHPETWGGDREPRPLADRIMDSPDYRDLYTHIVRFYSEEVLALPLWEDQIDLLKEMITPAAMADTFRVLDYGFDIGDFHNSYSAISYNKDHVHWGLKQFINERMASIGGQLHWSGGGPMVWDWGHEPRVPQPQEEIEVRAAAFSADGIESVELRWFEGDTLWTDTIDMVADPVPETKQVEEQDRWLGSLPALGEGGSGSYVFFVTSTVGDTAAFPRRGRVPIRTETVGIQDSGILPGPAPLDLSAYPNPFNPSTSIRLMLPASGRAQLDVYDLAGRHVVGLLDQELSAGAHLRRWDGRNASGMSVASGVYTLRLRVAGQESSRRVVLLK